MALRNVGEKPPSFGARANLLVRCEAADECRNHTASEVAEHNQENSEGPRPNDVGAANEDDGHQDRGENKAESGP